MQDDAATVLDMALACRRIGRFVANADEHAFLADEEKHWAVVSQLMLIGEAVRRLSPGFCDKHPSIPWRKIAECEIAWCIITIKSICRLSGRLLNATCRSC